MTWPNCAQEINERTQTDPQVQAWTPRQPHARGETFSNTQAREEAHADAQAATQTPAKTHSETLARRIRLRHSGKDKETGNDAAKDTDRKHG